MLEQLLNFRKKLLFLLTNNSLGNIKSKYKLFFFCFAFVRLAIEAAALTFTFGRWLTNMF